MNEPSKQISRRDWFRLRLNPREPLLGDTANTEMPNALSPIEHPPNYDGMDLSELPPLREANLSQSQVESLFGDIEQNATDIQLFQRGKLDARASANNAPSLSAAKQTLLEGGVKKLQIRYRWSDSLWIDTLESLESGFRLVRIAHAGR